MTAATRGFPGAFPGFVPELSQSSIDLPSRSTTAPASNLHERAAGSNSSGGRKLSLQRASSFRGYRRASHLQPSQLSVSPDSVLNVTAVDTRSSEESSAGFTARSKSASTLSLFQRARAGRASVRNFRKRFVESNNRDSSNADREQEVTNKTKSGGGAFVRSVAKRCSVRVRETSQSYRKNVNRRLKRIPAPLLKSVFTSSTTKGEAEPFPATTSKGSQKESEASTILHNRPIVRIPEESAGMSGVKERPPRPPGPADVVDGGVVGKLVASCSVEDDVSIGSGALREKYEMVVNEILETERAYVEALSGVISGYIDTVGPYATALNLTADDINVLFGNIQELYELNSALLGDLEKCESDPVEVSKLFVERKESFNRYTEYCTNFPGSVSKLEALLKQEGSQAAEFFKGCQRRLKHTLPLGAQLIKPVQRILKYHLLMRELLKHCKGNVDESALDIVKEACDAMHGVANHINEMKRQNEKALYIQELQARLTSWEGDELSSYGEMLKEGALRKPKKLFGFTDRKAYLFEKIFLLTKERDNDNVEVRSVFRMDDLAVSDDDGPHFRLTPLSQKSNSVTLCARDDEDKRRWTDTIRRAIVASDTRLSEETKMQVLAAISKDVESRGNSDDSPLRTTHLRHSDNPASNPSSHSPSWRRATVMERPAEMKVEKSLESALAFTPPERPPRPMRGFSSPALGGAPTTSPGLGERFSRLFSREATVGGDSTDGESPVPEMATAATKGKMKVVDASEEAIAGSHRWAIKLFLLASMFVFCGAVLTLFVGLPLAQSLAVAAVLAAIISFFLLQTRSSDAAASAVAMSSVEHKKKKKN